MKFLKLIQSDKSVYKFDGPLKFKFSLPLEEGEKRLAFVSDLLVNLQ